MTREEAINVLYGIKADNLNLDDAYTKDKYDALTMAIKALEQPYEELDFVQEHKKIPVNLQIIKQESKTIPIGVYEQVQWERDIAIEQLNDLGYRLGEKPRTEPTKTGHWIAYGKIWKCSKCEELSCCKGNYCPDCGTKMENEEGLPKDKPKTGRWIPIEYPTGVEAFGVKEMLAQELECSECGKTVDISDGDFKYCPYCKAKMESEG